MSKLAKILVIGLILLAGVATTTTLTLADSDSSGIVQLACGTCGDDVDGG